MSLPRLLPLLLLLVSGSASAYRDEGTCRVIEHSGYRYNGRDYTTEMPYDPGAHTPVRVDVEPVNW